jgi:hypothetical protein
VSAQPREVRVELLRVRSREAVVLHVSTDELLGVKPPSQNGATVSRRVLRRLQAIDGLPKRDQDALFRTIDAFLQARQAS